MSIETKYTCDVCGAVRGETNHWFQARLRANEWQAASLEIEPFISIGLTAVHLCGQKCAHALLDRWLATGQLGGSDDRQITIASHIAGH